VGDAQIGSGGWEFLGGMRRGGGEEREEEEG